MSDVFLIMNVSSMARSLRDDVELAPTQERGRYLSPIRSARTLLIIFHQAFRKEI